MNRTQNRNEGLISLTVICVIAAICLGFQGLCGTVTDYGEQMLNNIVACGLGWAIYSMIEIKNILLEIRGDIKVIKDSVNKH